MRISDWSSDVCSSDLIWPGGRTGMKMPSTQRRGRDDCSSISHRQKVPPSIAKRNRHKVHVGRSEEHTSELQSLMRISYAVFCLKKKKKYQQHQTQKVIT